MNDNYRSTQLLIFVSNTKVIAIINNRQDRLKE